MSLLPVGFPASNFGVTLGLTEIGPEDCDFEEERSSKSKGTSEPDLEETLLASALQFVAIANADNGTAPASGAALSSNSSSLGVGTLLPGGGFSQWYRITFGQQ